MAENGFLTDVDREFLRGEKEYETKQGRYDRRRVIAERTKQAFRDFALLYDVLDESERDRILKSSSSDRDEWLDFRDGLRDTIAFLYLLLEGDDNPTSRTTDSGYIKPEFGQILEDGVRRAESRRQPEDSQNFVEVMFEVTVKTVAPREVDWERLIDALSEGGVNQVSEQDLRIALALAVNPTDRLRELADLIEEEREGGRYVGADDTPFDSEELADEARTLSELVADGWDPPANE